MTGIETVKAETQSPGMLPIHINGTAGEATSIGFLLSMVAGAIFYVRRRMSRDNTEVIKDRGEGFLVTSFMQDRERLQKEHEAEVLRLSTERDAARASERTAWTTANTTAVENARLQSENEYQQRELTRLTAAMADLQKQFDAIKTQLERLTQNSHRQADLL